VETKSPYDEPTAANEPTASDPSAPDAASGRLLSPLAVMGIIALVGCFACSVAMLIQPAAERGWILPLATAACGLLGAWLVAWGRPAHWVLPSAILLLGLSATGFSLTWVVAAWPLAGCGLLAEKLIALAGPGRFALRRRTGWRGCVWATPSARRT